MSNATNTVRDTYRDTTGQSGDNLKGDVRRVGEDLTQIKDNLSSTAHDVAAAARSGYAAAKERAASTYEGARERGLEATETLQARIKESPVTSVAIAAGVGLLLGIVLARR